MSHLPVLLFCFLLSLWGHNATKCVTAKGGARTAQWYSDGLMIKTLWFKYQQEELEHFLLHSQLSALTLVLVQYQFQSCVTVVACKRSQSFCRKQRKQVTDKHTCMHPTYMWLWIKTGAWLYSVYRTCTKMAAVSRGTSHVACNTNS